LSTSAAGPPPSATSGLARSLTEVAQRAGAGQAVTSGAALFRVEVPSGQMILDLMPSLEGGFHA